MSAERWGVRTVHGLLRSAGGCDHVFAVGGFYAAQQVAAGQPASVKARPVKLVPKGTKAQRRVVFDDMIDERDTDDAINAVYDVIQDLDGKRVRITVEVRPDGANDEGGGT